MLKMPKTIIEQELEKHFERVRIFAKQVYDNAGDIENMDEHDNETIVEFERNSLDSAIQKAHKEAEKRIDEEFKEDYNQTGFKIIAKQILKDCFGVESENQTKGSYTI